MFDLYAKGRGLSAKFTTENSTISINETQHLANPSVTSFAMPQWDNGAPYFFCDIPASVLYPNAGLST